MGEEERVKVNDALLSWDGVVDCDKILEGLMSPSWWAEDGWHLTTEGFTVLGHRLANAISARYLPTTGCDCAEPQLETRDPSVVDQL